MTHHQLQVAEDRPDGVRTVLLHRPRRRNALDVGLAQAVRDAVARPGPRVIVLGSTDPTTFCAGGDLSLSASGLARVSDAIYEVLEAMVTCSAVVVVAADGAAIGGGAQLLLAGDLRIGGPRLTVGFVGAASGLAIGTWRLPGVVGPGLASDLSLTGRRLTGDEALGAGLVHRLVADPLEEARAVAGVVAAAPAEVVRDVLSSSREATLLDHLARERAANADRHHRDAGTRAPRGRD